LARLLKNPAKSFLKQEYYATNKVNNNFKHYNYMLYLKWKTCQT
jgi:hypothetical protein